jgi:hypothetical protein
MCIYIYRMCLKIRSYDSCVLTDPPTLICIKHNGDEEPEDYLKILLSDLPRTVGTSITAHPEVGHRSISQNIGFLWNIYA